MSILGDRQIHSYPVRYAGGWPTWDDYERAWATVLCPVCRLRGFQGDEDFESAGFDYGAGMIYAHRSCAVLGRIFPDMRGLNA